MLRHYEEIDPLILSGRIDLSLSSISVSHFTVPEEQEVSIEFVVNSVVQALERTREKQMAKDSSLAPFKLQIEWNREAADGQFRKPASNAKLAGLLQKSGVKFSFEPFDQGMN